MKTLELAITNYVELEKWDRIHHKTCSESRVHYTIDELQNVKCVGVGEIGLDHTTKCKCKEHQTNHQKSKCRQDKIAVQNTFLDKMLYALKHIDVTVTGNT